MGHRTQRILRGIANVAARLAARRPTAMPMSDEAREAYLQLCQECGLDPNNPKTPKKLESLELQRARTAYEISVKMGYPDGDEDDETEAISLKKAEEIEEEKEDD